MKNKKQQKLCEKTWKKKQKDVAFPFSNEYFTYLYFLLHENPFLLF